jgi:hypothetical protein
MIFYIVVRQVIAMVGISKFFHSNFAIYPLHRMARLKALGQYVVTIGLGLDHGSGIGNVSYVHNWLRGSGVPLFQSGTLYSFCASTFVIPLMEAHRLMQSAKTAILLDVAEQHESVFQKSLVNMRPEKLCTRNCLSWINTENVYHCG